MLDVKEIKNWQECDFTVERIMEVARQSAVYFMEIPEKLMTEDVIIKALSVNILVAAVLSEKHITRKVLEQFGGKSLDILAKAPNNILDASLSFKLVDDNIDNYAHVNSKVLPRDMVRKALAHAPVNIVYTDSSHIDQAMLDELDGISQFENYLRSVDGDIQFVLCQYDTSIIKECQLLTSEHYLQLLPLVKSDETKEFIMRKIGN